MVVEEGDKRGNSVITHSTIHGHIHTYDNYHRHIHGHIHKHHHTLPPNIDASQLFQQQQAAAAQDPHIKQDSRDGNQTSTPKALEQLQHANHLPSPSPSDLSSAAEQNQMGQGPPNLTHCQIQQIIDQCCLNSFERCFECSENDGEVIADNGGHVSDVSDSCDELSSDIECCDDDDCDEVPISEDILNNAIKSLQPADAMSKDQDLSLKTPEIKSHIASLLHYEDECFEPNCAGIETCTIAGDKCFEFCDFEDYGVHHNEDAISGIVPKKEDVVTDIPDSFNMLKQVNSSSHLSNLRSDSYKDTHKLHNHIHNHDVIHGCDPRTISDQPATKKRKASGRVEEFNYNWINISDAPYEGPRFQELDPLKQKDHLHCLWSNCQDTLLGFFSNDDLQSHVVNSHIMANPTKADSQVAMAQDQEVDMTKAPSEYTKNGAEYNCEWADCDFTSSDLQKLFDHIPQEHGFKKPDVHHAHAHARHAHHHDLHHHHHHHHRKSRLEDGDEGDDVDPDHTCKWEDAMGGICNRKFLSTQELTDHLIDDHVGCGHASYVCGWENCSRNHKIFNQRQKIVRHLHVHTKHRPHVCKICNKRFAVDTMLEQHMRIHTGEKPYQCSICAKWFKTSSSLSVHMRVHSKDKPLVCKFPGCGKRFNESSNLRKHYKIHQRPLKCCHCIKTFDHEKKLVSHLKLYHGLDDLSEFDNLRAKHDNFTNPYHRQEEVFQSPSSD